MNGMVQLRVDSDVVNDLRKLLPEGFENSMRDEQRGHHVTLAFKPENSLRDFLLFQFQHREVKFIPNQILFNDRICALFGFLSIDGVRVGGYWHITLGGTVPPKESVTLPHYYTGGKTVPPQIPSEIPMSWREVHF